MIFQPIPLRLMVRCWMAMDLHLFVWDRSHRQSAIVKQGWPLNCSLLRNPRARTFNARTLNNPLFPNIPLRGNFPRIWDFTSGLRSDPKAFLLLWLTHIAPQMTHWEPPFLCFSLCGQTTPLFYAAKILEPLRRLKANWGGAEKLDTS